MPLVGDAKRRLVVLGNSTQQGLVARNLASILAHTYKFAPTAKVHRPVRGLGLAVWHRTNDVFKGLTDHEVGVIRHASLCV